MPSPVIETLPLSCAAIDLLPALSRRRFPLALFSGEHSGDWDILTADPVRTLARQNGALILYRDGQQQPLDTAADAFSILDDWLNLADKPLLSLPFTGGIAGFWGYESLHRGLRITAPAAGPDIPELWVGDYRWALLHHRPSGQWQLAADTPARASDIKQWLAGSVPTAAFTLDATFTASDSQDDYRQAFSKVQDYLHAGDCYQVNLARHFSAPYSGSPATAFMALAATHSAPFSAYIGLPDNKAVLSFSPESFLSMSADGHIRTRPIKGTRPRHADAARDRQAAAELAASEKDRAENLMIVDLLRNDLGKCCEPGSITARKLFELESHANVHHLASTVEGQCRAGITPLHVLDACFPGGSITGAPKQRAMEIIAELETVRRSVYCGAIGYINADGQMNTSIAIRTLVADGRHMHCWGGSGIVADSNIDDEYQECEDKVRVFMRALEKLA